MHIDRGPVATRGVTTLMTVGDSDSMETVGKVLGVAGVALGAFHGYRRNNSVGWAIAWGIAGGLAPVIVGAIALAQGVGKPKSTR